MEVFRKSGKGSDAGRAALTAFAGKRRRQSAAHRGLGSTVAIAGRLGGLPDSRRACACCRWMFILPPRIIAYAARDLGRLIVSSQVANALNSHFTREPDVAAKLRTSRRRPYSRG